MRCTLNKCSFVYEGKEGNTLVEMSLYEEKDRKPVVMLREDPRNLGPKLDNHIFEDVVKEVGTGLQEYARALEAREQLETGKKLVVTNDIGKAGSTVWIHESEGSLNRVTLREIGNHFHQAGREAMTPEAFEDIISARYQEPNQVGGHDHNLNATPLPTEGVERVRYAPAGTILQHGEEGKNVPQGKILQYGETNANTNQPATPNQPPKQDMEQKEELGEGY